jgi:hypothetical protein
MAETMEMSALERAVEALRQTVEWDEGGGVENPLSTVRAVLQAIREPTPEMLRAGNISIPAQDDCTPCFEYDLGEYEAQKVWQAMIDALLTKAD